MSGTSLDGLDIALFEISRAGENTDITIQELETISYSKEIKNRNQGSFY